MDSRTTWRKEAKLGSESLSDTKVSESPGKNTAHLSSEQSAEEKNKAYQAFKRGPGADLSRKVSDVLTRLRALKLELSRCKDQLNNSTEKIKVATQQMESKASKRAGLPSNPDDAEVIDEEEYRMMKDVRDSKRKYREFLAEYKGIRTKISDTKVEKENLRSKMMSDFEAWLAKVHKNDTPEDDDLLDYGEQFDLMEAQRVTESDPDSLAFFQAQKTMRNTMRSKRNALKAGLSRKRR